MKSFHTAESWLWTADDINLCKASMQGCRSDLANPPPLTEACAQALKRWRRPRLLALEWGKHAPASASPSDSISTHFAIFLLPWLLFTMLVSPNLIITDTLTDWLTDWLTDLITYLPHDDGGGGVQAIKVQATDVQAIGVQTIGVQAIGVSKSCQHTGTTAT